MITYKDKQFVCLLDLAVEFFRGKWKAVILYHLNRSEKSFLELQRITRGVSQKVLTEKLRELATILDSLEDWSRKNFGDLEEK